MGQKVRQIGSYSKSGRRIIVLGRSSAAQSHVCFTCRFSAYTWTCALVLFPSYLICMYALSNALFSALTIENKLTFLGFIFVFSKPAEKTWRQTQEVRPYSQPVNPPWWPHRPFLSPPSILLPLYSPSSIYLVPPGLETPKRPPPSFSNSLFHWTPLQLEWGRHKLSYKGASHSLSRLLQAALYFMLRHVGRLLLSIYFNYVLIARCPFLNACLLFLSCRCEKFALHCDFLHYLNWWLISLLGFPRRLHERQKKNRCHDCLRIVFHFVGGTFVLFSERFTVNEERAMGNILCILVCF